MDWSEDFGAPGNWTQNLGLLSIQYSVKCFDHKISFWKQTNCRTVFGLPKECQQTSFFHIDWIGLLSFIWYNHWNTNSKGHLISEWNFGVFKSPQKPTKFLTDFCPSFIASEINHGPLNTWTEHSNCQIHSRGDSKTPIASLIPNIFLIFYEIIFLCI